MWLGSSWVYRFSRRPFAQLATGRWRGEQFYQISSLDLIFCGSYGSFELWRIRLLYDRLACPFPRSGNTFLRILLQNSTEFLQAFITCTITPSRWMSPRFGKNSNPCHGGDG